MLCCLALALFPAAALADAPPDDDWQIGFTYGGGGLASLLFSSGLGGLGAGPTLGAGLERRLDDRWWLTFDVAGRYASTTEDPELGDEVDSSSSALGASVGARYVANPGDRVTVGAGMRVGGRWRDAESCVSVQGLQACTGTSEYGVSAELDLVVALTLTEGLDLRLSTTVLEAEVGAGESTVEATGPVDTSFATVAVALQPRLGLFLSF